MKLLRSYLRNPNLNCHNCAFFFLKHKVVPNCKIPRGCEIKQEARDPEIHAIVTAYLNMRSSSILESSPTVREEFMRGNRLLEDLDLLIEMDKAFSEFVSSERKKRAGQRKGKKNG